MTVTTLGDQIQLKRVENGFSIARLAAKMGVAKLTIIRWETNAQQPNDRQREELERFLNGNLLFEGMQANT